MADGLIAEIQRDALDQSAQVVSLLRKVKLAAAKLQLPSLEEWVECELKGYECDGDQPRVSPARQRRFQCGLDCLAYLLDRLLRVDNREGCVMSNLLCTIHMSGMCEFAIRDTLAVQVYLESIKQLIKLLAYNGDVTPSKRRC
jgi:hypothetical protein